MARLERTVEELLCPWTPCLCRPRACECGDEHENDPVERCSEPHAPVYAVVVKAGVDAVPASEHLGSGSGSG